MSVFQPGESQAALREMARRKEPMGTTTTTGGIAAPDLDWDLSRADYPPFDPAETVAIHVTREEGELLMDALDYMALAADGRGPYADLYQKIGPQVLLAHTEGTA